MKVKELFLENYQTEVLNMKVTVYVLYDDDMAGMSDMYDGDDEDLKHRLDVLNATQKQPYWLDEDDEKVVLDALKKLGQVEVTNSYIREPDDEDDFPDLIIEMKIKDATPDAMRMRGKGVSSYNERQEVWTNLVCNTIEGALSAHGRDMSIFDTNIDTHWEDRVNEGRGQPTTFSVEIYTEEEDFDDPVPFDVDDLHDDAPPELRAKFQKIRDEFIEKHGLNESDSKRIKQAIEEWGDDDQEMHCYPWDFEQGGVVSASLYPHISGLVECYGHAPYGYDPGWTMVIREIIDNTVQNLGKHCRVTVSRQ